MERRKNPSEIFSAANGRVGFYVRIWWGISVNGGYHSLDNFQGIQRFYSNATPTPPTYTCFFFIATTRTCQDLRVGSSIRYKILPNRKIFFTFNVGGQLSKEKNIAIWFSLWTDFLIALSTHFRPTKTKKLFFSRAQTAFHNIILHLIDKKNVTRRPGYLTTSNFPWHIFGVLIPKIAN